MLTIVAKDYPKHGSFFSFFLKKFLQSHYGDTPRTDVLWFRAFPNCIFYLGLIVTDQISLCTSAFSPKESVVELSLTCSVSSVLIY